ncbi:MAG TPA: ATP-binding protein [Candidatus Tectomicrobia bacterium]|nr:ATP-binding protein [Candidatus Tectomicrobia bacterium]
MLTRSPLGPLVRWVASVPASVHAKLLGAFLVITVLFLVMAGASLALLAHTADQSRRLDAAHERVSWAQQIEHALARQMHFASLALLLGDEASIAKILRENNRFNDTLARLEAAASPDQRELIQRTRLTQDEVMVVVADIANAIRDRKLDAAMRDLLGRQDRLHAEVESLVERLVSGEQARMAALRDEVDAAQRRSFVLAGAFAMASIGLALLCGFVISWAVIDPVRRAHGFLAEVAAGNFGVRMSVPNRDELGELAARMNQMTRELQRLDQEQREAAARLRQVNEELALASRAKSQFLANMSHELRTPMNAILGFTEMLLDGLYGDVPAHLKEPLADIQVNGRHLLRLINDVLDLSKIEAGRMELALDEYTPAELIDAVRVSLRSLAAEKGLALATVVPPDLPVGVGDAKRLTQCLMNLTGNALKFTRQGRIEVGVAQDGDRFVYHVADTGIGIPKDELENIFAEFRQVDTTTTREFGGTGLGLSITRKFVEMHGGRIWVESEPGKGSTFFFTIPVRAGSHTA